MYSSDGMKTLIRKFKNYGKNIVFMDCQMKKKSVYLRRKVILLIIFRHCVELPAKNLNMINSYWTTFETLTEIERDCKERQLCVGDCSSLWLILLWMKASNDCSIQKYQTCVYYWWNISSVWLLCDIMEKCACLLFSY